MQCNSPKLSPSCSIGENGLNQTLSIVWLKFPNVVSDLKATGTPISRCHPRFTRNGKGDDGTLSELGIKEVSQFWINRKSDGKYGEQVVGPQVKGCIPEATLTEFNPRLFG